MTNATFVDENDQIIGHGDRSEAIEKGIPLRISRVFVFNKDGELLIQKRSPIVKIPDRWDGSASGHVDEGEDYLTAANREASEEIGLKDAILNEVGKNYTEEFDDGRLKKRFTMIYATQYDKVLRQDNDEVSEIRWINQSDLQKWIAQKPEDFTQGFVLGYRYYLDNDSLS